VKRLTILVPLMVSGCATGVYHPTKPATLMQADIDLCTEQATLSKTIRVAAMEDVVACLKTKGYVNKGSLPPGSTAAVSPPRRRSLAPFPAAPDAKLLNSCGDLAGSKTAQHGAGCSGNDQKVQPERRSA
jgi:hypothetical protein